jgi:hypothetical protein
VLKTTKKVDQEKKPEEPKGDFPKAHKEGNYIYSGPDSYESRRNQKLTTWEVMAVSLTTPEYLKWSKVPITLDRSDHPDFVPKAEAVSSHCQPRCQGCKTQPSPLSMEVAP